MGNGKVRAAPSITASSEILCDTFGHPKVTQGFLRACVILRPPSERATAQRVSQRRSKNLTAVEVRGLVPEDNALLYQRMRQGNSAKRIED